jgi:hypothetical protein
MKANVQSAAKKQKQTKPQVMKQASSKKENKTMNVEAKKELRKKLLTGKIDQETYDEEMKKLI